MQRNCGGVNADGHGTNALSCLGKFVREPKETRREKRCVFQGFPSERWY